MRFLSIARTKLSSPIGLWSIGVSFLLFQFFLQLSSGVIITTIMHEMRLSALIAGLLSSSFYFIYTALQIPVGILFDRKSTRTLLSFNALICSVGCLIFAKSTSLVGLFIGRTLIGAGSAFAFIGLSHILRQYFPKKRFAFMIGLSETLGFAATAIGINNLGNFVSHFGWRLFMSEAAGVGIVLSFFCYCFIPKAQNISNNKFNKQQLKAIIINPLLWINGVFVGLSFSVVTVFAALWALPFLQAKLGSNTESASHVCGTFFIGAGLSCPLFGILASVVKKRSTLIVSSCLITAFFLCLLIYYPTKNIGLMQWLMFLTGLSCGAYMLAYSVSNELAPAHLQSSAAGLTNTLAVLFSPLLQPLIGFLLDRFNPTENFQLLDFQKALSVIPLSLVIASLLSLLLPEKSDHTRNK